MGFIVNNEKNISKHYPWKAIFRNHHYITLPADKSVGTEFFPELPTSSSGYHFAVFVVCQVLPQQPQKWTALRKAGLYIPNIWPQQG